MGISRIKKLKLEDQKDMEYLYGIIITGIVAVFIHTTYKEKQKMSKKYEIAIVSKFPEAENGYRLVKGIGTMDHVYVGNKLYVIVFSQGSPHSIVYAEELNIDQVHEFDHHVVTEKIRNERDKGRRV